METWVVATSLIGIYLLITLGVAVVANRHMTVDMEDFLLCGRRTGFIVLYLTVVATFHSAFAFLGSGGFFFTHGVGFWAAGAWTLLVGACTYVVGSRIWALGKAFGYITPADMLADFYESEAVRVAVALVSVLFTILYIQVQALALGYIMDVATDGRVPFQLGMLIMLTVAVVHLMIGGLRAVYWTDVFQGAWMYIAIWAGALVLSYKLFGGPLELWQRVAAERPEMLTLPGPEGFFTPGMWVGMVVTLSFGIVFQPHMMIRFYTAVDGKTLKLLGATTPIYLMTLYIPAALVGLGGAVVLPDLAQADRVFPELLFQYAPAWLTGIILAGAAAAAMSTLDSILHANMTVLTRDVYQRYVARDRSQAHYVLIGRLIVLALLAVAFALSITESDLLVAIVTLSGAGALQLMPAIVGVCFPGGRSLSRAGVLAGLGAGLGTLALTLGLDLGVDLPWGAHPLGIHGGLWGLAVNSILAVAVSAVTPGPSRRTVARVHGEVERFVHGDGGS